MFYFRLALALGMTVDQMLKTVRSDELAEWMAFYSLDPFGDQRADYRMGIVAAVQANSWRGQGQRALSPEDFLPFKPPQRQSNKRQSPSDMRAAFDAFVRASAKKAKHGNSR